MRILPEQISGYRIEDHIEDADIDFLVEAHEPDPRCIVPTAIERDSLQQTFSRSGNSDYKRRILHSERVSSHFNKIDRNCSPSRMFGFYLMLGQPLKDLGLEDETMRVYLADMLANSAVATVTDLYGWSKRSSPFLTTGEPEGNSPADYWAASREIPEINHQALAKLGLAANGIHPKNNPSLLNIEERFNGDREGADLALFITGCFGSPALRPKDQPLADKYLSMAVARYKTLQGSTVSAVNGLGDLFGCLSMDAPKIAGVFCFLRQNSIEIHPELVEAGKAFY